MNEEKFGCVKLHLDSMIKASGLSKNKVANLAQMQRTQLNKYCNGTMRRLDLEIVARLCYALDCTICDLLEYVPDANDT